MQKAIAGLLAASLLFVLGCSDSKVVLLSEDGSRKLVYDPNNFHSQVETPEELGILIRAARETISQAASNNFTVSQQELVDAMISRDWRRLEQLVVRYRANHQK